MTATSVTFCGSLGELVSSLRVAARTGIRREVQKIFPETARGISIHIRNTAEGYVDFEAYNEWRKFPERRQELLQQGRISVVWPFFDNKTLELEKTMCALYSPDPKAVEKAEGCFGAFLSRPDRCVDPEDYGLKEIRQYFNSSCCDENEVDIANNRIARAVERFNKSLPPAFEKWRITHENFRSRPSRLSKPVTIAGRTFRPRPAPREWEFTFPLTIQEIDKLINFAETWANRLKNRPKTGRPPRPFNALLFHVVNAFTQRCFTAKREYIMKDGKFRVRKNWQLVIASLLWLHVLYDIPEIRAFIKTHENEEARAALKKLVSWAKSEYSHFRESGKGRGKFGLAFADGSEWLNIPWVYLREDGSLSGRLL